MLENTIEHVCGVFGHPVDELTVERYRLHNIFQLKIMSKVASERLEAHPPTMKYLCKKPHDIYEMIYWWITHIYRQFLNVVYLSNMDLGKRALQTNVDIGKRGLQSALHITRFAAKDFQIQVGIANTMHGRYFKPTWPWYNSCVIGYGRYILHLLGSHIDESDGEM